MNQKRNLLIGLVVLIVLVVGSTILYNQMSKRYEDDVAQKDSTLAEGAEETAVQAADFTVIDAAELEVNLAAKFGKPIVLNFWASWCSPCAQEMPYFQKAYEQYGDTVQFIMVNMTDGARETMETANNFIAENGYTFPIYYDTEQNAAYTYSVNSIPTTYFIDENGEIVTYVQGTISQEGLNQRIEKIVVEELPLT